MKVQERGLDNPWIRPLMDFQILGWERIYKEVYYGKDNELIKGAFFSNNILLTTKFFFSLHFFDRDNKTYSGHIGSTRREKTDMKGENQPFHERMSR